MVVLMAIFSILLRNDHRGFGESHINTLLAVLNIPGICHKNLKEREREKWGKNLKSWQMHHVKEIWQMK